ncbi:MAG: T9SS type A sorting domain-containing protein [Bacteroidales bacterium]|nr:T9SS type A sorting domain-containing protein [Bacteroidales bacterium]
MIRKYGIALLSLLLLAMGFQAKAQSGREGGIHFSGGISYDTIVSSNIGSRCYATGQNSFAGGDTTLAQGLNSFAFGYRTKATNSNCMALGYYAQATSSYSYAIGKYVKAQYNPSVVIGSGYSSSSTLNSKAAGITMGMGSTNPTLFLSKATGSTKTGKVAIGNVTPTAKLHIRSDQNEDAGIILEPNSPTANETFIRLADAFHHIAVDKYGVMDISAGSNLLDVGSSNFNVEGGLISLGASGYRNVTVFSGAAPSIGVNAAPSNGGYMRGVFGSSYVLEFGDAAMKIRAAVYEDPRGEIINNWVDAITVTPGGSVILNGKVGVNIENTYPSYALAVDGGILTTKVHIQDVTDWSDDVFGDGYRLMPLHETKEYIAANGHLPEIPSEAEVKHDGYDVNTMQAALLRKIEELTLHVIRQQEEIDSLRTMVTVHFGYDACGNRTSRTLEFKSMLDGQDPAPNDSVSSDDAEQWHAELHDVFVGREVALFPNPTDGSFILSLAGEKASEKATATLCTLDGKLIEERLLTSDLEAFDLGGKPAGIYLLRLTSERETKAWKVIKRN